MFDFFRSNQSAVTGEWPRLEDGTPVAAAYLTRVSDKDGEQFIVRGMLESFGIPSVARYPLDGDFGTVIMGTAAFGAEIFVPETLLEEAKTILNSETIENEEEL